MSKKAGKVTGVVVSTVLTTSLMMTGVSFAADQIKSPAADQYASLYGKSASGVPSYLISLLEETDATESTEETSAKETTTEETTTLEETTTEEFSSEETTSEEITSEETTSEETTSEETTSEETTSEETTPEETTSDEIPVTEATTSEETTKETTTSETTEEETLPEEALPQTTTREETEKDTTGQTAGAITNDPTTSKETTLETTTSNSTTASREELDVYKNIGVVINDKPEKFGTLYWPLPSEYGTKSISSGYGYRTGTYSGMHAGVDIAAPEGTPIYACADGVVYASYYSDSAGNFTIIQHEDGLYTEYMHQSVRYVKAGEKVKAGQMIGLVGNTGWSTGSHLHIGLVISENGYDLTKRVNPLPYLLEKNKTNTRSKASSITEGDLRLYYAGGSKISEKALENPTLLSTLEPVFSKENIQTVKTKGFDEKGYLETSTGKPSKKNAVELLIEPGYKVYEKTWVRYETDQYDIVLRFRSSFNKSDTACPFAIRTDSLSILANTSVYKTKKLKDTYTEPLENTGAQYYAIGVHVDMYKHGTKERVDIPDIYQVLKDVDMGQAYICLNEAYEGSSLFIKNKISFDKNLQDNSRFNYITDKGDIYSDFSADAGEVFENPGTSDVVRKTEALGEEGLDLVFGFTRTEEAGLSFSLPHHTITFNAEKGGTVSVNERTATYGDYLDKGSIAKADVGYKLKTWITDQDVIVEDMKLKKGSEITMAQIESLVVTDDLSFTAVFEKKDKRR